MLIKKSIFACFVLLTGISAYAGLPSYNYGNVELHGKVIIRTKYGPPNFEKDGICPAVKVPMLQMKEFISITPIGKDIDLYDPVSKINVIQIVELDNVNVSKYVGRWIKITGELSGALTGSHYTKAILEVRKNNKITKYVK
jgi:hypothetical protein